MKKYLIQGALALATAFVLSGCHEDDISGSSTLEQKAKAYEETFVEAFGMPNANHNWGFGTVGNARTRAVIKPDMTDYPNFNDAHIYDTPAAITDGERAYVANWFHENTGFTNGLNVSNFYLQHVTATNAVRQGLFHNYEKNLNPSSWTEEISAEAHLDHLQVGSETNLAHTEHVFDFNGENCGDWETVYIQNGSALQFGVHSSWGTDSDAPDDSYYWYFKCAEITVPGENFEDGQDKTAWYVGICYYGKSIETKDANGNPEKWRELGNENLAAERCEDWILKVVPGEGETIRQEEEPETPMVTVMDKEYTETVITQTDRNGYETEQLMEQGRVFCEDLGSTGRTDIDFNDLVYDAKIWHKTKYERIIKTITTKKGDEEISVDRDTTILNSSAYNDTLLVLAAGGTLPLTVAGREVGNLFGVDYLTMVNTVTTADTARLIKGVKYNLETEMADPVELTMTGYESINQIPLWVEFAKETKKLNNASDEVGYIPRCLLVPMGTQWATERTPIDETYAYFDDYVRDMTNCWDDAKPNAVYPSTAGLEPSPESAFTVRRFGEFEESSTDIKEGGEEYVTHEIEVDQPVPDMVGTQLTLTFMGRDVPSVSLQQYYETTRIGGINSTDYVYISPTQFSSMHSGDKLRIYGIGANSDGYIWRLYTGTASNNLSGGDAVEGSSYNDRAGRSFLAINGYIETEITDVETFKSTGYYIAGTNFTLLGVTIIGADSEEENNRESLEGNLLSSTISLGGGVQGIISDQTQAQSLVNSLVVDSSVLAVQIQLTSDGWYFSMGTGTTGNNLFSGYSNNASGYGDYKSGDIITIRETVTQDMLDKLSSNVNNTGWWSQAAFAFQGSGADVIGFAIEN